MEESKNSQIVYFQCCTNCSSHSWCTRHDQAKYQTVFFNIKKAINKHIPELQVANNVVPKNYVPLKKQDNDNRYFDVVNKKSVYFPGLGAFQVYFKNILIFSKYESQRMPQAMQIINLLLQVKKEWQSEGHLKKYQMFELRQNNLIYRQQNLPQQSEQINIDQYLEYQPLSLAEYERCRSKSKSKKRHFGNKAYNKIFSYVQKQLQDKNVRNMEGLFMDQNINLSQRQNLSNQKQTEKSHSVNSHQYVFMNQQQTNYSRFTQKNMKKANNVIKNVNQRDFLNKQKNKTNSSSSDGYWMYRGQSKNSSRTQQINLEKIKHLKNDIDKLTQGNNKKLSELSYINSQMPPLIKHSNSYNQVLMKMPQFVRKKADGSEQRQEMILRLDNISEQEKLQFEKIKCSANEQRKTPYKIMNQWDRELQMLESKFQKFQKKVQLMKQKKKQFQNCSDFEKKFLELIKSDKYSSKQQKQLLILLSNEYSPNLNKAKKPDDYVGISPEQRSQKLKRIYGRWKLKEYYKNKKYSQNNKKSDNYDDNDDDEIFINQYDSSLMSNENKANKIQFNYGVNNRNKSKRKQSGSQSKYHKNCNSNFSHGKNQDQSKTKRKNDQQTESNHTQIRKSNFENLSKSNSKAQVNAKKYAKPSQLQKSNQYYSRVSQYQQQYRTGSDYYNKYQKHQSQNKTDNKNKRYTPNYSKTASFMNDIRNSISQSNLKKNNDIKSVNKNKYEKNNNILNHLRHSRESNRNDDDLSMGPSRKDSEIDRRNSEAFQQSASTIVNPIMKKIKSNEEGNLYRNMKQQQYKNSLEMKKYNKNQSNQNKTSSNNSKYYKPGASNNNQNEQNQSKDNKVTSHGKRSNKMFNQNLSSNRQNDSVNRDKQMSRSQTSRNLSLQNRDSARNNSKNMSQRSNRNGSKSKKALNSLSNQIRKNDPKSKSDNNFYSNKSRRIDQKHSDVAEQNYSKQGSLNGSIEVNNGKNKSKQQNQNNTSIRSLKNNSSRNNSKNNSNTLNKTNTKSSKYRQQIKQSEKTQKQQNDQSNKLNNSITNNKSQSKDANRRFFSNQSNSNQINLSNTQNIKKKNKVKEHKMTTNQVNIMIDNEQSRKREDDQEQNLNESNDRSIDEKNNNEQVIIKNKKECQKQCRNDDNQIKAQTEQISNKNVKQGKITQNQSDFKKYQQINTQNQHISQNKNDNAISKSDATFQNIQNMDKTNNNSIFDSNINIQNTNNQQKKCINKKNNKIKDNTNKTLNEGNSDEIEQSGNDEFEQESNNGDQTYIKKQNQHKKGNKQTCNFQQKIKQSNKQNITSIIQNQIPKDNQNIIDKIAQNKNNNSNQNNQNQKSLQNYEGPTNRQRQQNGSLMIGSQINQNKHQLKTFKDAGIQNSFNDVSCQTNQLFELNNTLNNITNKMENNQINQDSNNGIYQRKLDMKRANILNNLYYDNNDIFKKYIEILDEVKGNQFIDNEYNHLIALKGLDKQYQWESVNKIYKQCQLFPQQKKWNMASLSIDDKKNMSLGTVLKILVARKPHLITRLFENYQLPKNGLYGVWICNNSAWTPVFVDSYVPVQKENQAPAFLNIQKYIWPLIIEKALSKVCRGYHNLQQLTIPDIFKMLTGSNFVTFKVKQDPSMNSKAIKYVSENENKNFILHCEKHKKEVPKNAMVKLPQVLIIQSTQSIDQKDLIQLKLDQGQPFWMKFQIFCQTFKSINLLHLRQTYLFTHIPVVLYPNSYTVVQLQVQGSTSAQVSVNHLSGQDQLPKSTRVILYRQQQKSILKLVGQAKQKNKKLIFFDCNLRKGRYFLFIQSQKTFSNTIISYAGDQKASLSVIQNIQNITLKNKHNQYIPVIRQNKSKQKQHQAPKYLNNIFQLNMSHGKISDNNSEKFQKIKNQFLDYLTNEK